MKLYSFPANQKEPDFKALFENAPGALLVLTKDFTIVAVSNRYLHATMTERSDILGKNLFEVFPDNPNDNISKGTSNLRASLNRVLTQKKPDTMAIQKYDIRRPGAEGGGFEERFWSPVNTPVLDQDNNIRYIIHRVEDVTEFLKLENKIKIENKDQQRMIDVEILERNSELRIAREKLEEEQLTLKRSEEALRQANAELESFSYSISHDLRAPLRSIDGFSKLLQDKYKDALPEEAQHFLKMVRDSASEMGNLIDDLLAFSRMARQEIVKQKISATELANEIVEKLKAEEKNRKIEVVIDNMPVLYGDRNLLKQVFVNLLSNAFKYTKYCADTKIKMSSKMINNHPVYYVQDNGAGFDMRYAHKLFGVFQRLHRSDEYEGTGVGLAIVDRIVKRHNGKVWAESEPGKGATFYFTVEEG